MKGVLKEGVLDMLTLIELLMPPDGPEGLADAFRQVISRVLGVEVIELGPPEIAKGRGGMDRSPPGLLGGLVASEEIDPGEFIIETLNGLVKENDDLRALCEEYRGAIEKLRAKVVEQDSVIEKLVVGKSGMRNSLS
jgi:hypothetical protein